jgi:hypothetical protein
MDFTLYSVIYLFECMGKYIASFITKYLTDHYLNFFKIIGSNLELTKNYLAHQTFDFPVSPSDKADTAAL